MSCNLFRANSGTKYLEADQMYYIEVLYYDVDGNDWLVFDMIRPGDQDMIPVSLKYLYPGKISFERRNFFHTKVI